MTIENEELKSLAIFRYFKELEGVLSLENKPTTLLQKLSDEKFNVKNYTLKENSMDDISEFKYIVARTSMLLVQKELNDNDYDNLNNHKKAAFESFFDYYDKNCPMFQDFYEQLKIEQILKEKEYLENNGNTNTNPLNRKVKI